jgi:hypothetical protein
MNAMKWLNLVSRILIAGIFIFSAIAKILEADAFEVYIYQLGILSFDWSAWLARLIIGTEMVLAIGFLTRAYFKIVWSIALITLLLFSLFLLLKIMAGEDSNCFCFGELLSFTPMESLVKNLLLLILLVMIRKLSATQSQFVRIVFGVLSVLALAVPIILSPPDNLIPNRITPAEMDRQSLRTAFAENLIPRELAKGRKMICFYSTSCKFCQLSSSRISAAFRKYELSKDELYVLFLGNDKSAAIQFLENTEGLNSDYSFLPQAQFLDITKGRMPLLLMIDDGIVTRVWNYRQIDEQEIRDFFEN